MSSSIEQGIALLKTLWQTSNTLNTKNFGELRLISKEGALKPLFLKLPLQDSHLQPAIEWALRKNAEDVNVYFGIHQRITQSGRNEFVPFYNSLVVDIDNLESGWPEIQRLINANLPPSICVRTPRGVHAYWLLQEPESTTIGNARYRMQLLQKATHSDNVHDPARVLRLPGTSCNKNGNNQVTYIEWLRPDLKYISEQIEKTIRELHPNLEVTKHKEINLDNDLVLEQKEIPLEEWIHYTIPAEKGTRSELCLGFIQMCLYYGWPIDNIYQAIMSLSIGGHYLDRGNPLSSFMYDLEKARRNVYHSLCSSLRVVINDASLLINPPVEGQNTDKLVVRFVPYGKPSNEFIREYITIPKHGENGRFQAFLSAVGLTLKDTSPPERLLDRLPGRVLRIELSEERENKIKFFYKDLA